MNDPKHELVGCLRRIIAERAKGAEELSCYWFGADFLAAIGSKHDSGDEFCWNCAKKIVDDALAAHPIVHLDFHGCPLDDPHSAIDGGWSGEHDSTPFCEGCGVMLEGSLTDYGVDEELLALTGEGAPRDGHPNDWRLLERATDSLADDDQRWQDVSRVVDTAGASAT